MIKTLILLLFCVGYCQAQSPTQGMKAWGDGEFWYKLYSKKKRQPRPQVGDQVHIDYRLCKDTKILKHSYNDAHPVLVQIPPKGYDNFFTHALCLMGKNDSLVVKIKATDIPEYLGEFQPEFMKDDWVTMTYKMHNIKPAAVYQAEQARERFRADSIRTASYQWVRAFQRDSVAAFSGWATSKTGLRYQIHRKGEGNAVDKGITVQLQLIGFLPDASIMYDSFESQLFVDWEVGSFDLIQGIAEGVALLNEGGSIWLYLPSALAYGKTGVPDLVPPHTPLFFYVEVAKVLK